MSLPTRILAGRAQFAGACASASVAREGVFSLNWPRPFEHRAGPLFGGVNDRLAGGVRALPNSPSEVVRRNAFQRLAGGSSVLFSSFRVTDSGGQKVRPDLHVLASSLAVAFGPVGPVVVCSR